MADRPWWLWVLGRPGAGENERQSCLEAARTEVARAHEKRLKLEEAIEKLAEGRRNAL